MSSENPQPECTPEMVREALAHVPFNLGGYDKWKFISNFINRAMAGDTEKCPCCGVTPQGDHD